MLPFLSCKAQEVELLGQRVGVCSVLRETARSCPRVVTHGGGAAPRFQSLRAPAHVQCRRSLNLVILPHVWRSLVMASICICLMTNAVEHIFMYLSAIHICSFVSCLFKRVAGFKIGLLAFFLVLSGSWSFVRHVDCKYFFPVRGSPTHFFMVYLDGPKFVILISMRFNWTNVLLSVTTFCVL